MKTRNNVRWEWKYHGDVEAPKIVCVRCVGTTGLSKHGFAVGQATVKMYTKQVSLSFPALFCHVEQANNQSSLLVDGSV